MHHLFLPILFTFSFCVAGCNSSDTNRIREMQTRLDSLQRTVDFLQKNYKPGFGQAMVKLERHYHQLWFAAERGDWARAGFELHEIESGFAKLQVVHNSALNVPLEESMKQSVTPALEQVEQAVEGRNRNAFRKAYEVLTKSCNDCHMENALDFLMMRPPVSGR